MDICQGHWFFISFIFLIFSYYWVLDYLIRYALDLTWNFTLIPFWECFFSVFIKNAHFQFLKHLSFDLSRRLWYLYVMNFSEVTLSSYLLLIKTFPNYPWKYLQNIKSFESYFCWNIFKLHFFIFSCKILIFIIAVWKTADACLS